MGKERDGSDGRVDRGGTRRRHGRRRKYLRESSVGKERDRSDDRVHGEEAVGNSLGRVPLGSREGEATTG